MQNYREVGDKLMDIAKRMVDAGPEIVTEQVFKDSVTLAMAAGYLDAYQALREELENDRIERDLND